MRKFLLIFIAIASVPNLVNGQDSLATLRLDEVVITGQFEAQSARKSVYGVRTIPLEVIQARGATKIQDILNTELNVRFSQDAALGGSDLSLQGLSGQNVKVLIDGLPMIGRQGTSNEININQINIQSIERIEIIEGPMSVVYGADALAGVINIITKKNQEGRWQINAHVQEESAGNEYNLTEGLHNQSVSGGYSWGDFTARLDINRNIFGGWQGNAADRDKQWHPKSQLSPSAILQYKKDNSNLYYRIDYLNEDIYNPGVFDGNEALDQNYITNRFMHQVQGGHEFNDKLSLNSAVGFTNYSRRTRTSTVDKTTGDRRLALGEGLQDETNFDGITARGTLQFKASGNFSVQPGFDLNFEQGEGGRIKSGVQEIGDYAFFTSVEWEIFKGLKLRPGVRFIYNTVYDAPPAVPSVNAKFSVSQNHDLRFAYGRGFRAPSLRELYFDFFDASHSIEGNPNLQAELSHSFNASWNWKILEQNQVRWEMTTGGFYNSVKNMIGYGQKPSNTLITTYLNIDHFKTQGFTLNNKLKYSRFDASLGLSYTGRYNQYSESDAALAECVWSPEVISTLSYKLPKQGLIFSLYYKYTGSTPYYEIDSESGNAEPTLARISDFNWADVTIQKDLFDYFTVTGGVRNLFDVVNINNTTTNSSGAHSTGASRPIGYGRSYFLGLTFSINSYK